MMYMIMFYVIRMLKIFLTECGELWIRDEYPSWSFGIVLAGRLVECFGLCGKWVCM